MDIHDPSQTASMGMTTERARARAAAEAAPSTSVVTTVSKPPRPARVAMGEEPETRAVPETDQALVDAMEFFDDPAAEPQLPFEQMIYTPVDEAYSFQEFPGLPVIPDSMNGAWRAVQLNLTHDGALGAALVALAADKEAFARVLRPSDKAGHYIITLKLPTRDGQVLDVATEVDARVPATASGRILGATGSHDGAVWPLVVAKGIGKLVRVLRASGHLPDYRTKPALTFVQFHTWLTGRAPEFVEHLRAALNTLFRQGGPAIILQVPNAAPAMRIPGVCVTQALGGMAHRLRSDAGDIDVLLLNGHHYGVVAAGPKHIELYNPLGFNPHPRLADRPDRGFFDPHSLGSAGRADATMSLPAAWLRAIGCAWFL